MTSFSAPFQWINLYVMSTWVWNCILFQHFDWNLTHQVLFLYFFPAIIWTWETSTTWEMHILWCRTADCSNKLFVKVSLMLDNPFPVVSLCKLNHISVCFIEIIKKITYKQLVPFRESHMFFEVIPGVLVHSITFNII